MNKFSIEFEEIEPQTTKQTEAPEMVETSGIEETQVAPKTSETEETQVPPETSAQPNKTNGAVTAILPAAPYSPEREHPEEGAGSIRKTVLVSALAGSGVFGILSLMAFLLQGTVAPFLSEIYKGIVQEAVIDQVAEIDYITQQLDWKYLLLGVHQQFGSILMMDDNLMTGEGYTGNGLGGLFVSLHFGTGILLLIPFLLLAVAYYVCRRWVNQDPVSNKLFLVMTSFVYAALVAVVGMNSGLTVKLTADGIPYTFSYSIVSVFSFTFITGLLFLTVPYLVQEEKRQKGLIIKILPFLEAFKLVVYMVVSLYIIMFLVTRVGIAADKLQEEAGIWSLMLTPLFLAVFLFNRLEIVMDNGAYFYSLFNGEYYKKDSAVDDFAEFIQYLDHNHSLLILSLVFILFMLLYCMRKGYLFAKYSGGNSLRDILFFTSCIAAFITLVVYLSSYDVFVQSQMNQSRLNQYQTVIKVEEIYLLIKSFAASLVFTLIGSGIHWWKLRGNRHE